MWMLTTARADYSRQYSLRIASQKPKVESARAQEHPAKGKTITARSRIGLGGVMNKLKVRNR